MKSFSFRAGSPLFLTLALLWPAPLFGETPEPSASLTPPFAWSLLWSGAWEDKKDLTQRGDLRLSLPRQGLTLRSEILDKEPAEFHWPWEHSSVFARSFDGSGAAVQGGLYHNPTGTRLLYGALDDWGLPARLRNTWQHSAPFAENRKPSMADLKTAPASSADPEFYLYLGSPHLSFPLRKADPPDKTFDEPSGEAGDENATGNKDGEAAELVGLRGFGSARIGQSDRPTFGGGLEGWFGGKVNVNLEGFYTGWTLPAKKSSAWFSESPPLPERDFRLYGLGLLTDTRLFGLSSDWAWSETFAWGRDFYGALGLRIGRAGTAALKGWQLSLAVDKAGPRFTGSDGSGPGEGFRTGTKIEWRGRGGRLFRANTTLRSPGLEEPLNRISAGLYYRLPPGQGPFSVNRFSLSADWDERDREKPLDGLEGAMGFSIRPRAFPPWFIEFLLGEPEPGKDAAGGFLTDFWLSPLHFQASASLKGIRQDTDPPSYSFYSFKAGGDLSWSPRSFQFRLGLAYGEQNDKEGLWDFSFSAGVRVKPGRFGLKIASADFPGNWAYTLSWRLEKK
ncbi:MAG: hypothetical protein LBR93_06285 [Treponema sp.]|jgi:hypothetical protein|nr:hypothetical protein [Treponema sp.]